MRGPDDQTNQMFSYLSPEQRVRADHPLRAIRAMTDRVFAQLSPRFTKMYSDLGRPSIPPEQLLRALLLQSLYTVRSERLLMEEIDYSVLYRWFVGLSMDDPIWSPTTFSKNRDRLLESDIASAFFDAVIGQAREAGLLSDEHFTVDGTLLEAWASLKSFRRKDGGPTPPPDDPGNPTVNFHGESRRNDTHQSTTDPDARLARKGQGREAKLSYAGHVLLDNRHGLVANVCTTPATGTAEREAAELLLDASAAPGSTVGGDKNFDVRAFVAAVRALDITPHVAQKAIGTAIDGRTTRHPGYAISQPPSQTWHTFPRNHVGQIVAADFFVVPTLTYRLLFVLVLLAHDRRRIRHVAVTAHPTAAWTAQQLREAFPWEEAPRYLLHDRDQAFDSLRATAKAMGIEEVLTAPRAPWQKDYASYCTSLA